MRAFLSRKLLICGLFCAAVAPGLRAGERFSFEPAPPSDVSNRGSWPAEPLLGGRVELLDESADPALRSALSAELKRLAAELHERQGWRIPTADGDPLRIFIARRDSQGLRRLAVRSISSGRLVGAVIQLDASGMNAGQIVRELARLYAFATLTGYGVSDRTFLTAATAEYLSGNADNEEERERTRILAAATTVDVSQHPTSMGGLYVEEFARAVGGGPALRALWEKASERGEELFPLFLESYVQTTGERAEMLLLKTVTRLYSSLETEPGPARIGLADLELAGLDAATPASLAFRHRTTLPPADSAGGALRVLWPEQGAPAAAVIRYRDAAVPPDIVMFAAGQARTIPFSGVARVDWVVSGSFSGPPLFGVRGLVESVDTFPYTGLAAQAIAGPGGPHIGWTTASHEGMLGWAVFREEVLPDGRIARTGPHIIPSSNSGRESFRYTFVDPEAAAGTFYRYTVWAVTEDGLLARAFSATLRTQD